MNTSEKPFFYRNRLSNFIVWMIVAWAFLYFLIQLVHDAKAESPSVFLICLDAALTAGFAVPVVRLPRHGVWVTSNKLTIYNILKTHVIYWDDVERFELISSDRLAGVKVGTAVLKDGAHIAMTGVRTIAFERAYATRFAKKTITALNAQLAEMR